MGVGGRNKNIFKFYNYYVVYKVTEVLYRKGKMFILTRKMYKPRQSKEAPPNQHYFKILVTTIGKEVKK